MHDVSNPFAGFTHRADRKDWQADIVVLGVPHGTPYTPGQTSHAASAPTAIRSAARKFGSMHHHFDYDLGGPLLDNRDLRVVDGGDVPGDPANPERNRRCTTEAVLSILDAGALPVVLGGDDSIVIPFLQAFSKSGPLTLVQFDAHIDWRDDVHGVTTGYSSAMRRASEMGWVQRIVQVGIRGVGSAGCAEVAAAADYGARIVTARQLFSDGIGAVLAHVPAGGRCVITLDCDVLDPSVMPAVRALAPGGLSYTHVVDLLGHLTRRTQVIGFDLVELSPADDTPNRLGALTAARIVWHFIGSVARSPQFRKNRLES